MLRGFLVSLVVAAVAAAGPAGIVTAAAQGPPGAPAQSRITESVLYLTSHYGVSAAEAVRRLELQRDASALADRLDQQFPDQYAGMWMDQEHGGVLVVGMTRPEVLAGAVADMAQRAHIRAVQARSSRRDLSRVAQLLQQQLSAANADVTVDDVQNQVVVRAPEAELAHARDVAAGLGLDRAKVSVQARGPATQPASCTIRACGPPMRGGLELDIFDYYGNQTDFCTSSFNVRGSNGWAYTLTAGHCLNGTGFYSKQNGTWVGHWYSGLTNNVYPNDYAIMPYVVTSSTNYAVYWLPSGQPKNWVYSLCQSPQLDNAQCTSTSQMPIYGMYTYNQIGYNWIVCAAGATDVIPAGTRCGKVTKKDNGIVTDICIKHGDSGGPLYSQIDNRAYGITHGSSQASGSCVAGQWSDFSPLSNIFSQAQYNTGIAFSVQTS